MTAIHKLFMPTVIQLWEPSHKKNGKKKKLEDAKLEPLIVDNHFNMNILITFFTEKHLDQEGTTGIPSS